MGIVNQQEHAMATAIFEVLTEQEKRQVRMFGATREDVDAAVDSYLTTGFGVTPKRVIMHMLMSAWSELNWGQTEDARQTLNRVKVTIQRFYNGDERGFFFESEGQAYSILSDAQHLMEYEDIVRAKMCIDEAHQMIEQGVNI
jgi:hypothetical protein